MTLDEYQEMAGKTASYPRRNSNLDYPSLGLCSEAGEVAGKVKKLARDYGGVMTGELRQEIKKELGDTLWYIAAVCDELQLTLNDVAVSNIAKLHDRQQRKCIGGDGDNR